MLGIHDYWLFVMTGVLLNLTLGQDRCLKLRRGTDMKLSLLRNSACALLLIGAPLFSVAVAESPNDTGRVLFVCEHGSVKSVMAATFFDEAARKRGLAIRAMSRGVTPDERVPSRIVDRLRLDGIDVATFKPTRVEQQDIARAIRVVAIGVDPTSLSSERGRVETWNDIPESSDYLAARAALIRHIDALLDEIERSSGHQVRQQ